MKAAKIDLVIPKGTTYRKTFYWKDSTKTPIDLSSYTARLQAKKTYRSTSTILDLTTTNGGVIITALEGKIVLYISDTDTTAIAESDAVYDLELISGSGDVIRLMEGTVTFLPEVTT